MKKILVITVALMLILTCLLSCKNNVSITTLLDITTAPSEIYAPGTFQDDIIEDESYAPVGGHNYYNGMYNFKSKVVFSDRKCSDKTIEIFGKTYKLDYNETRKPQFAVNSIDFYIAYNSDGKRANVSISYLSDTNQIVGVLASNQNNLDETKKGLLKVEDDYITYAKELVSDYLKISEYEVYVEYSNDNVLVYFYKLLDGYRTKEWVRVLIRNDGALKGIDSHNIGSYESFKNVKFDKKAIEWYAAGNKIEYITIINDDGDLIAEIKYWGLSYGTSITHEEPQIDLLTRYVPLTKQSSASKVTTSKVTTAAPPIVTTPRTTELVFTTAPAEPILKPQG